jgi:hypothetical protein
MASSAILWLVLLAGAPPPAAAASPAKDEYAPISAVQVKARDFRIGEKRSFLGKYQELINQELKLHDIEARFVLGQPGLRRQLLELKPQKDNVIVYGSFLKPEDSPPPPPEADQPPGHESESKGLPVFQVERIENAPSDVMIFESRLRELLAVPSSSWQFEELGKAAAASLHRFSDPALAPVARQAFSVFFQRAQAGLAEADADGRLELIKTIHSSLKDDAFTLELLRTQVGRYRDHAATRAYLAEVGFFRLDGKWLTYADFKTTLGFVLHDGKWVKPLRKEFLEVMALLLKENPVNMILRNRTDREYSLLAHSGKVEKGMTRAELNSALGMPDRVERETAQGGVEIDQWNYGERRVYLFNGHVATTVP